ncbi:MAG: hypothetical protein KGS10_08560 [Chloroflexi bacterium]|nr:hypothetical protein [Chloroflexota bacterium]
MGAIRRAYIYAVALVSLGVMAASVNDIVAWVAHGALGTGDRGDLPLLSVAGVIVQVPVWVVHWAIAQASVKRYPEDRAATIRRVYLVIAIAGAVGAGAAGVSAVVRGAVDGRGADAVDGLAAILTAVPVLLVHRNALARDLSFPETRVGGVVRRLFLALFACVASLVALSSVSGLVGATLETLLGVVVDDSLPRLALVAEMSGTLVAAALVWATHHRGDVMAVPHRSDAGDSHTERQSFLPALYRVIVMTVGVGVTLGNGAVLLDWATSAIIGPPVVPEIATGALASVVTYATAWWAFRRSLIRDLDAPAHGATTWVASFDRVHRYVVTVVALAVAATGIAQIAALLLDIALGATPGSGSYLRDVRYWGAITAIGLPTWAAYWRPPGHSLLDLAEIASRPRRGALYVVVFACALSLITAGVWVTYGLLGMALGKPFDFPTVAFGATGVAAVLGTYQLSVLRAESRVLAAQAPTTVASSLITQPDPSAPWAAIREGASGTIVTWHATAAEARATAARAGSKWHAVARLDDGVPVDGDTRTVD